MGTRRGERDWDRVVRVYTIHTYVISNGSYFNAGSVARVKFDIPLKNQSYPFSQNLAFIMDSYTLGCQLIRLKALIQEAVGNDEGHRPEDILAFLAPIIQRIRSEDALRAQRELNTIVAQINAVAATVERLPNHFGWQMSGINSRVRRGSS